MRGGWVQVFQDRVHSLSSRSGLSLAAEGALWRLSAYLGRQDTVIRQGVHGRGDPASMTQIASILGVSRWRAADLLRELVDAGALTEARSGRTRTFAFDPRLAHRFRRIPPTTDEGPNRIREKTQNPS